MAASLAGWYLQGVEAMHVAQQNLQRHQHGQQPQGHGQHQPGFGGVIVLRRSSQAATAHHHKAGGDIKGRHRVQRSGRGRSGLKMIAIQSGGIEAAIDDA